MKVMTYVYFDTAVCGCARASVELYRMNMKIHKGQSKAALAVARDDAPYDGPQWPAPCGASAVMSCGARG